MKTIGILELRELVNARLINPKSFAGKSLILWNADYLQYGIAYRVIEECCIEYNLAHTEQQKWIKYSDMTFTTDENTNLQEFCDRKDMYGYKNSGILFNTGCFLLTETSDWLKFVNTHQNARGDISTDWPLIACAHTEGTDITEDNFAENCEIYKLYPTVDEWEKWTSSCHNEDFLRMVIAYTNGSIDNFDYWERALDCLESEYKNIEELKQTKFESFAINLSDFFPRFPADDFWNFIQK